MDSIFIDTLNGKSFSDLKNLISEILVQEIEPIGKKINELLKDKDYLDKILLEGSIKANNIAEKKVKELEDINRKNKYQKSKIRKPVRKSIKKT